MAIEFPCSQCGQTLKVGEQHAGAKIRCPKCRAISVAPAASETASTKPSADVLDSAGSKSGIGMPSSLSSLSSLSTLGTLSSGMLEALDEVESIDLRKKDREEDELDMTPMVDVTFLLLIFFMVTAAFSLQKSLEIPAPDVDKAVNPQPVEIIEEGNIVIRIDKDSTVWVNDVEAPSEQDLRVKIREAKQGVPGSGSPPINSALVEADRESLHEVVVMALDACNAEHMEPIKLATVSEDDF